jgi:hypothetical protein
MRAESKSKLAAHSKFNPRSRMLVEFFAGSNSMRIAAHCNNNLIRRVHQHRTQKAWMFGSPKGATIRT